eukprot:4647790-Amphidinium_carterae.1
MFAVRKQHIHNGLPDPLAGRPRVWMALAGLERLQGGKQARKFPVTPEMLLWMRSQLDPEHHPNHAIFWAALCLAFLFLMRITEYAWSQGWQYEK